MRGFCVREIFSCHFVFRGFQEILQLLLLFGQGPLVLLVDDIRDI